MSDGARCQACGLDTVITTARGAGCAACGAGVTTVPRRLRRFLPKGAPKEHKHHYEYERITYETGTKASRWVCTKTAECPAFVLRDEEQ